VPSRRAAPRTTTSYAVLGLLSVCDWGTYELAKQVRRSLRWFWPRTERKLAELAGVNEMNLAGADKFPQRLHRSVLALRLHVEQEIVVHDWARWARAQVAAWPTTCDPGDWDITTAQREPADRAASILGRSP